MRKYLLSLLALLINTSVFSQVIDMNELAFCAYHKIKKTEISKEVLVKFLEGHDNTGMIIDEFEYQKLLDKKSKLYKKIIDTLNINNTFTYNTTIDLGEYDFEKQGFPLKSIEYFPNEGLHFFDFVCSPTNSNDYCFLQIEAEKGNLLLKQIQNNNKPSSNHTRQYWEPIESRVIKATFKFSFNGDINVKDYEEFTVKHYEVYVLCKITELKLYDKGIKTIYVKPNK